MRKTKVLVVDDSLVFRKLLAKGISIDPGMEVVGTAEDPYEARDMIVALNPDVVVCDIELPRMSGIDFVSRLIPQHPIPVIVISSASDKVYDALNAGAVEFIGKPNATSPEDVQKFVLHLIKRIKEVACTKAEVSTVVHRQSNEAREYTFHKLIAIGASTGGTEAIYHLLKQLPRGLPPIVIVQHIPPVFSEMFARRLDSETHFVVKEAVHGDIIECDHVYLAPGDKHVELVSSGSDLMIKCYTGEKVNGHCPSVDVLFQSAARVLKDKAIGVILTGMGYDGARGMAMMHRRGAYTIGQNEASCVVYGMPKAAADMGAVTKQTTLEMIGFHIMRHIQ